MFNQELSTTDYKRREKEEKGPREEKEEKKNGEEKERKKIGSRYFDS